MIQVTYQKRDGSIIYRLRNSIPPYRIGESTSMGWTVMNIEYRYKDKFYSEHDLSMIIYKKRQLFLKKQKIKELFLKEIKAILYYIIIMILLNLIHIL